MKKKNKLVLILLLVLNVVVLLGQLWPQGAPPFARFVNVLFLVMSLVYFSVTLRAKKQN